MNNLHKTIKEQIKESLRARDSLRLDTLRGLNALFTNEIIASKATGEFLPDDKVLTIIKRSVKQRKDSIEQFEKGGREDLAQKERAELVILESFMPTMMSKQEVALVVKTSIDRFISAGTIDPKNLGPSTIGKATGMIIKELAGKADGSMVKALVEEVLSK